MGIRCTVVAGTRALHALGVEIIGVVGRLAVSHTHIEHSIQIPIGCTFGAVCALIHALQAVGVAGDTVVVAGYQVETLLAGPHASRVGGQEYVEGRY